MPLPLAIFSPLCTCARAQEVSGVKTANTGKAFQHQSVPARQNGNITVVATQIRGRQQQVWSMQYDAYDRMTAADFYERASRNGAATNANKFGVDVSYDKLGNIKTLERRGMTVSGSGQYGFVNIDDLSYTYPVDGSYQTRDNRLTRITDVSGSAEGYNNTNVGSYTYDDNGNTTYDPSRGVTIAYNHLDLPVTITWADGRRLVMVYDAAGTLLQRSAYPASGNTPLSVRDYVGGIEYVNGQLRSVYHEEGRVAIDGSSQQWQYNLTDHLGNTRLTYADDGDGVIDKATEIVQENHYYPFGLKMTGPWMGADNSEAYQYNGIDYVEEHDLGVNMAMYRTLDPAAGRWWSVDPKAESFMGLSPYNSMGNSPMNFADPMGDEPITIGAIFIGMAIGAGTHTASHLVQNNFTFQNWNWGNFIGSTVAGGVTAGVGHFLEARHIGGFAGGFITGASAGLSHSLTSNIINPGFDPGQIASTTLFGGLSAGVIGGLSTGKGYSFWNGRSTTLTERYLIGPGGTNPLTESEINDGKWLGSERMSLEDAIRHGEVGGTGPRATDAIATSNPNVTNVNPGFEGSLRVRGRVFDSGGRDFVLTVDGKTQVLPTGRVDLTIPSNAKNIGWGFRGSRALQSTALGNNRIGLSVSADSYLYITGNHRGWNGFLFWGRH